VVVVLLAVVVVEDTVVVVLVTEVVVVVYVVVVVGVVVGEVVGVVISHPLKTPAEYSLIAAFRSATAAAQSVPSIKYPAKQAMLSSVPSTGPVISLMMPLRAVAVSEQELAPSVSNERRLSVPSLVHFTVP